MPLEKDDTVLVARAGDENAGSAAVARSSEVRGWPRLRAFSVGSRNLRQRVPAVTGLPFVKIGKYVRFQSRAVRDFLAKRSRIA